MKLALLTTVLVAVIAGTASASLFLNTAQPDPTPVAPAVVPQPPKPAALPKPQPKPMFEIRQAPVPSLGVSQRSYARKAARADEPDRGEAPIANDAPTLDESLARAAILADGYRSARMLARTADGRWTARVMRGSTEIGVTVDAQGRVSAD